MKTKIQTDNAPAAIGPYSPAIRVGDVLFTSGQIPLKPGASELVSDELVGQAQQVFQNIKGVVEAAGAEVKNIVKMNVFVTNLGDFATLNKEYAAFFDEYAQGADYPARSTVEVSALPMGAKVEIEAIVDLA